MGLLTNLIKGQLLERAWQPSNGSVWDGGTHAGVFCPPWLSPCPIHVSKWEEIKRYLKSYQQPQTGMKPSPGQMFDQYAYGLEYSDVESLLMPRHGLRISGRELTAMVEKSEARQERFRKLRATDPGMGIGFWLANEYAKAKPAEGAANCVVIETPMEIMAKDIHAAQRMMPELSRISSALGFELRVGGIGYVVRHSFCFYRAPSIVPSVPTDPGMPAIYRQRAVPSVARGARDPLRGFPLR